MGDSYVLRDKMALSHLTGLAVGSDGKKTVEGLLGAGQSDLRTSDAKFVCLVITAPGS